jgi:nitrate/nitrite-specific signal transduction histidine kinase
LRITTPLRKLAAVARQLAEGESPADIPATTTDEVGQLTRTFNAMTAALRERSAAITSNMETIRKQITQLTAVHQTSAAITSTLDLHELLDTVLQLLRSNLGFSRMALMLRDEDRDVGYVAQVAGVSDEIAEAARFLSISIKDDDTILADLLVCETSSSSRCEHGRPSDESGHCRSCAPRGRPLLRVCTVAKP